MWQGVECRRSIVANPEGEVASVHSPQSQGSPVLHVCSCVFPAQGHTLYSVDIWPLLSTPPMPTPTPDHIIIYYQFHKMSNSVSIPWSFSTHPWSTMWVWTWQRQVLWRIGNAVPDVTLYRAYPATYRVKHAIFGEPYNCGESTEVVLPVLPVWQIYPAVGFLPTFCLNTWIGDLQGWTYLTHSLIMFYPILSYTVILRYLVIYF